MHTEIKKIVKQINKRKLTNNTQRTLFALLTSKNEWVARTALRIPSVGARIRDLRKPQFGSFAVSCVSAKGLERRPRKSVSTNRQTFYRLDQNSVTVNKVVKVFKGVIATTK